MNARPSRAVLLLCVALALGGCGKAGTGGRFGLPGADVGHSALHAAQRDEARRAFQYPARR